MLSRFFCQVFGIAILMSLKKLNLLHIYVKESRHHNSMLVRKPSFHRDYTANAKNKQHSPAKCFIAVGVCGAIA